MKEKLWEVFGPILFLAILTIFWTLAYFITPYLFQTLDLTVTPFMAQFITFILGAIFFILYLIIAGFIAKNVEVDGKCLWILSLMRCNKFH